MGVFFLRFSSTISKLKSRVVAIEPLQGTLQAAAVWCPTYGDSAVICVFCSGFGWFCRVKDQQQVQHSRSFWRVWNPYHGNQEASESSNLLLFAQEVSDGIEDFHGKNILRHSTTASLPKENPIKSITTHVRVRPTKNNSLSKTRKLCLQDRHRVQGQEMPNRQTSNLICNYGLRFQPLLNI